MSPLAQIRQVVLKEFTWNSMQYAEMFKQRWQAGEGLLPEPRELFEVGIKAVYACIIVERFGGFLQRMTAKSIRKKIEKALVEAGHLRTFTVDLLAYAENETSSGRYASLIGTLESNVQR